MRKSVTMTILLLLAHMLQAQDVITLRVMTMNIKEGASYAGHATSPYSEIINEWQPDVVAFQEVDHYTSRNGHRDWINNVAVETGMFPYYCRSFTYQGGGFGVALLSRYPFFDARKFVTDIAGTREPRATGVVRILLPDGHQVRVASVHLSLESSQITIRHLADINSQMFAEDTLTPTLLVGDFNAVPDSDAIAYAKNRWQDITPSVGNTIPASNPGRRLDFIMGYPKRWTSMMSEVIAMPDLSDHCFIVADVSIAL